jgi:arylsulfatase
MPFSFSGDEGADIGTDNETPVTEDDAEGNNRFTGRILRVTVEAQPPQRPNKLPRAADDTTRAPATGRAWCRD